MIAEDLCVGCGICVHKCPFEAVKIIGLPEELEGELVHQYGKNGVQALPAARAQGGPGHQASWDRTASARPPRYPSCRARWSRTSATSRNPGTGSKVLDKYAGHRAARLLQEAVRTARRAPPSSPSTWTSCPQCTRASSGTLLKKVDEQRSRLEGGGRAARR